MKALRIVRFILFCITILPWIACMTCLQGAVPARMAQDSSGIIPGDRRTLWEPGIPGGIPDVEGPVVNLLDQGADPTGSGDSHAAFVSAMNALPPSGGVVLIPEGDYRIGSKLTVGRDSVVFRGEGSKSRLLLGANGDGIEVVTYRRGDWQALGTGVQKGATKIHVPDGSRFTTGGFAEIEQENDSLLMYTATTWIVSWAENSVGQVLKIGEVIGDTLFLEYPVNLDFSTALNARIRPNGLVEQVGFEDLYLEKTVAEGHTLLLKNSAHCWIRNIESYHTRRTHVHQNTCFGNEIRDSYFHHSFSYGGGGAGYGVECGFHVTGSLVENNMFDSLRHAMIIQTGANGNVYGYNFSTHPVQGEGETNLNVDWIPPDISIHGHYPYMNLFEGNEVDEIGIADYWGPAGPGNTYFRNKVNGDGIIYYDASHRQNLVGNVTNVLRDQDHLAMEKLEHGNVVNGTVYWDPDITTQELPASYYLDSVPSFFGEADWPLFGPEETASGLLPARDRYEHLPYLHVSHPSSVGKYLRMEFSIDNGKNYVNPFDPDEVDMYGIFQSPSGDSVRINAFWDGSGWRLRFAGAVTGTWNYTVQVRDSDGLEMRTGTFQVSDSGEKGWIQPSATDPHYLVQHDGSSFFGVGMAVPWLVYDERYYEQPGLLDRLSQYGVNLINWLFTSWDILLLRDTFALYSMEDAEKFDQLLADAETHGIKLLLGIWIHDLLRDDPHPWSGFYDWSSNPFNQLGTATQFFSDSMSWKYQENYYRYIIARWGYSSSIGMWHTVAEINGTNAIYDPWAMENDERGWHNRIDRYFREHDPFGHPTSVSGSGGYDFSPGWEVTACPQAHEYPYPADRIKENPDRIAYWASHLFSNYDKPALVGEFGKSRYEEGISESFLHNGIWAGVISGACSTPLHWWGGQIAVQPENFSTFNQTMLLQLQYLKDFLSDIPMQDQGFVPLYGEAEGSVPVIQDMPEGGIYALKGDSLALCWLYHVAEHSTTVFRGTAVSFPGLREGRYAVRFFDTWNGEWMADTVMADAVDGILQFGCPDFVSDLAVKIAYAGPIGLSAKDPSGTGSLRAYPNPCRSVIYLESPVPVRQITVTTLTGQVVERYHPDGKGPLQVDLSARCPGVYLIHVLDDRGLRSSSRIVRL